MKERSKKFAWYLVVEGMQKAAGILLVPVYTTYMVPQQFGILSVCLSLAAMIPVLFFASIYEAAYFSVLKHENDSKDTITVVLISETLILFIILMSVGVLYLTVPDELTFFNIPVSRYILSTIVMASLSVFQFTINQILVASEKTGWYVFVNLVAFIFTTVVTLYLLIIEKLGVMSFIIANSAVYFIYFLAALWMLKWHWRVRSFRDKVREVFKFSVPLIPHTLAHWTRAWADRLLLSGIVTPSSTGIYQISTTYSGVMLLGIEAFRNVNNPRFFSLINDADRHRDLSSILSVSLGIFSFCALVLGVFSRELITILTSHSYHEAYRYVPIILSAHLTYLVYINTVNVLFNATKTRKIASITMVSSFVSILIGYQLIKFFGITGAAVSTLFANMLMTITIYLECQKTVKIPWPIIRGIVFALLPMAIMLFDLQGIPQKILFLMCVGIFIYLLMGKDLYNAYKF